MTAPCWPLSKADQAAPRFGLAVRRAGREDLASAERFEIDVLSAHMPAALSEAEVLAAVQAAIESSGASSPADMGKVMAIVKPQLAGRADMGKVSRAGQGRTSKALTDRT